MPPKRNPSATVKDTTNKTKTSKASTAGKPSAGKKTQPKKAVAKAQVQNKKGTKNLAISADALATLTTLMTKQTLPPKKSEARKTSTKVTPPAGKSKAETSAATAPIVASSVTAHRAPRKAPPPKIRCLPMPNITDPALRAKLQAKHGLTSANILM